MKWDIAWGLPAHMRGVRIFLGGIEQRHVRAFDTEEGWVTRLVLNENGQAQVDPIKKDQVWEETVRGVVAVAE